MEFKPQDIIFAVVLSLLVFRRDPKYFVYAGILSLLIAMPLFYKWIFFTAERLVLYAFIFFSIAVLLNILKLRHNN